MHLRFIHGDTTSNQLAAVATKNLNNSYGKGLNLVSAFFSNILCWEWLDEKEDDELKVRMLMCVLMNETEPNCQVITIMK